MKAPLLTLMAGGNPEVEYCILKHLEAVVHGVSLALPCLALQEEEEEGRVDEPATFTPVPPNPPTHH